MSDSWLPYGRQWIDDDDIAAVVRALKSDFLTTGPAVAEFEQALAERVGAKHAVACANGTAALHLALLAAGVRPGDSVIVPAITFVAAANMATHVGATVRFADVDPATALLTPNLVRAAAEGTERVRVLTPVHFAGAPADMPALATLASELDAVIIEDASHALGATSSDAAGQEVRVGGCRHSAMTTFSFHPVKHVAAAEGGAVTTNDSALADAMRALRNHGLSHEPFADPAAATAADGTTRPWYYEVRQPGFNYRLSDVHAALGRSQLRRLDAFLDRRRALARAYVARLADSPIAALVRPLGNADHPGHAFHLFVVRIDFARAPLTRSALMAALREAHIGTQVHYIPVSAQPFYRGRDGDRTLPGAAEYYDTCLSLPLFPAMPDEAVDRVVSALERLLG